MTDPIQNASKLMQTAARFMPGFAGKAVVSTTAKAFPTIVDTFKKTAQKVQLFPVLPNLPNMPAPPPWTWKPVGFQLGKQLPTITEKGKKLVKAAETLGKGTQQGADILKLGVVAGVLYLIFKEK